MYTLQNINEIIEAAKLNVADLSLAMLNDYGNRGRSYRTDEVFKINRIIKAIEYRKTWDWQLSKFQQLVLTLVGLIQTHDNQWGINPIEVEVPLPPQDPTYNTTITNGQVEGGITLTSVTGLQLKFNLPLPSGTPTPAVMSIYINGSQVGQVDLLNPAIGQVCGIVYNGITYHTTFINGTRNL